MYKIVNDNFKIKYDEQSEEKAKYYAEILNRILCVAAGFTTETYNLDFSIGVPLDTSRDVLLTLCNKNNNLYIGAYEKTENKLYMTVDINVIEKLSQNTLDMMITLLHDNETYAAINHHFMPIMHSPMLDKAWDTYINSNRAITPAKKDYVNIIKSEMSVREYYEMSISKPRIEFICWMLDKNPSSAEISNKIARLFERIQAEMNKLSKAWHERKQQKKKVNSDLER